MPYPTSTRVTFYSQNSSVTPRDYSVTVKHDPTELEALEAKNPELWGTPSGAMAYDILDAMARKATGKRGAYVDRSAGSRTVCKWLEEARADRGYIGIRVYPSAKADRAVNVRVRIAKFVQRF